MGGGAAGGRRPGTAPKSPAPESLEELPAGMEEFAEGPVPSALRCGAPLLCLLPHERDIRQGPLPYAIRELHPAAKQAFPLPPPDSRLSTYALPIPPHPPHPSPLNPLPVTMGAAAASFPAFHV